MRNKKSTLLKSIIALVLCVAMLMGTTYAWFTDSVESGLNTIAAGNLDVELYHSNAAVQNEKVDASTELFMDLNGKDILWEPGVVSYENLRVVNEGDLALAYQLALNTANENYIVDPATGAQYGLSQVLQVGIVEGGITATDRDSVLNAVSAVNWLSLEDALRAGVLMPEGSGVSEKTWGVVIYWKPGVNDNFWNLNNGKTLNEGDALTIDLGVNLIATQEPFENDSFDKNYDAQSVIPNMNVTVAAPIENKVQNNIMVEAITVEATADGVSAQIPVGVTLTEGATELTLSVKTMESSDANISVKKHETKVSLDVHVEGVAEDNTAPMLITLENYLPCGLNTTSVQMFHVENDAPVEMTLVVNPTEHNQFSYDAATGTVVLCVASFSEYVSVTKDLNLWEGDFDYSWYAGKSSPYTISSAAQLAGFGAIVDGTAEGYEADTFEGKIVYLNNDIDLTGGVSFNPIGSGYADSSINSNGVTGRPFMGTFDGQGYTISNLNQNGWDIGLEYCNLGGGLFASVANATIQNLTIMGANITMECVELGIVAGLSQGECTFKDINIYNSAIANYQRATGGVVGEVSPYNGVSKHTFENINVGPYVTVGTLWGDFDAPVGGVVGAKWDDNDTTQVVMKNVTVSCKLDVYNDVTSTYQWYAYRRAGMLIGNTEESSGNTATADFLTCSDVKVYYGSWVDYHYCEFNNHNPSWPWVRVEEGEHCNAFSNPRYGVPNDPKTGKPVTGFPHNHSGDDECNVELEFNQLYGGGQGVYGESKHLGVTVTPYRYAVLWVNDAKVLDVKYVTEAVAVSTKNQGAEDTVVAWAEANISDVGQVEFGGWMNAGSTPIDNIDATNDKDVVLYPYFEKPYTAFFVDLKGNVLESCYFHSGKLNELDAAKTLAESRLPEPDVDTVLSHWEVNYNGQKAEYKKDNFKRYEGNVTVYPVYTYQGNLNLKPHDTNSDGITDYYTVESASGLSGDVMVPGKVNGIPVTVITDLSSDWLNTKVNSIKIKDGVLEINSNAFAMTLGLSEVEIPASVTKIGENAFANTLGNWVGKVITITYDGTWEEYKAVCEKNWERGLASGTKVVCNDGTATLKAQEYLLYSKYEWTFVKN